MQISLTFAHDASKFCLFFHGVMSGFDEKSVTAVVGGHPSP